jgi:fermentation-respiration switch protein FrsA (DUF1100 family)
MIGTMRAHLTLLGCAATVLAAGCGGSGAKSTSAGTTTGGAQTAPAQPSGPVLEETRRPADPAAVRVIRDWTDAQRASNVDRATSYFALPVLVENGTAPEQLPTRAAVRAFNAALPCGAVLLRTSAATQPGFTVATFRLVDRPGQRCDGTGNQARTAFGVRAGKIRAWVRIPDRPQGGSSPAPQPTSPQPGNSGQAA